MFTSLDAARHRRTERPQRPSALRLAIQAAPDSRSALFNRLLRAATVLLALVSAALMAAAVLLP
ncbi:hypothetical protein GCM10028820_20860 [Tessaracoccus terricola]